MPGASDLHIPHPRRLIAITPGELAGIVPNAANSAPAYREGVNWQRVAEALAAVGAALDTPPSFRRGDGFSIRLGSPLDGRERVVVEVWLGPEISPALDATEQLVSGKTGWLASVLSRTQAPVPIHLSLFDEIREAPRLSDAFRTRVSRSARTTVDLLPPAALWRSPLAAAVLRRVAQGDEEPSRTEAAGAGDIASPGHAADGQRLGFPARLFRRPSPL